MNKLVLLLLVFAFSTSAWAQEPSKYTAEWGDKTSIDNGEFFESIVGPHDGYLYSLTYSYKSFSGIRQYKIRRFDLATMSTKKKELIKFKALDGNHDEKLFFFQNQLYFLYSNSARKEKQLKIELRRVNQNTLQFEPETKVLLAEPLTVKISDMSYVDLELKISPDGRKLAVFYSFDHPKSLIKFGAMVFDQSMNKIYEMEHTGAVEEDEYMIKDVSFHNSGEVYVIGKNLREIWKPGIKRTLDLIRFSPQASKPQVVPVTIAGRSLSDAKVSINEAGEVIVAGFYSTDKSQNLQGTFSFTLNPTDLSVKASNEKEFSFDMLTTDFSAKDLREARRKYKNEKLSPRFQYGIDHLVKRSDGGHYLIGEHNFTKIVTLMKQATPEMPLGGSTTTTGYVDPSNDIMVVSFSPEGQIEWSTKVTREASISKDDYLYKLYDDELYLLFNSHRINDEHYKDGTKFVLFGTKKPSFISLRFGNDGKQIRAQITQHKKRMVDPSLHLVLSDQEDLFFSRQTKSFTPFRMTVK